MFTGYQVPEYGHFNCSQAFHFLSTMAAESFLLNTGPHTVSFLKIQACQILEFETLTLDNMCVLPPCYENHSLYLPCDQRIVNAEQA